MSTSEQLNLLPAFLSPEERKARKREWRREHKTDYRKFNGNVPTRGVPFVIVPEIAPIFAKLADQCGKEAGFDEDKQKDNSSNGITILAARAAVVMKKKESGVHRRLYAIINKKQLFVNANFVECVLASMDAEHDFTYGEWPSRREAALERVSIEAELKGEKVSPSKLLARANRLYEKGVRKALKRAVEVTP